MKSFIIVLLAIVIFGPRVEFYDQKQVRRFSYTGIIYGIVQYLYWMVGDLIAWRTEKQKNE